MQRNKKKEKVKKTINRTNRTLQEIVPVEVVLFEQGNYRIGKLHEIGNREEQQDAFAVSDVSQTDEIRRNGLIAIVADGMGGLQDGDKISSMVVLSLFQDFHNQKAGTDVSQLLLSMLANANKTVNQFLGEEIGSCGSTLVAGIIKEDKLYWISVGDSHIYLYRGGKLLLLNREHIYLNELELQIVNGEIPYTEAVEHRERAALNSFIGMGRLMAIDRNRTGISLGKGDRILFMSDGVFGTLTETQIVQAMQLSVEDSVEQMHRAIVEAGKKNQDNYTAVIVECL